MLNSNIIALASTKEYSTEMWSIFASEVARKLISFFVTVGEENEEDEEDEENEEENENGIFQSSLIG